MRQRNISPEQIKETVLHADRLQIQGKGIRRGVKWNFKKRHPGIGLLGVVAEIVNDTCYLVTAYWIVE
jgi:hypothetical protein